jgi:hypothetical protein
MKKTIQVEALTEWKDVTLKKYLEMTKDIDSYKDDESAMTALMLHHLAGIPYDMIPHISAESYNVLKNKLSKFMTPEETELQRFITIDGVEYGFEPNLSKMTYGAYADISKYDTLTIDKNWAKIMSILYRPVVKKERLGLYQIKPYDGDINEEKWLDVTMDIHFGCLFFFINLQLDLMKDTLKSLTEMELPPNIHTILVKSGQVMQRYTNLQKEI